MDYEIMLAVITLGISLLLSLFLTKWWIRVAKRNGLEGKDMNKYNRPLVIESGGIAVVSAIILSLLFYVFLKTFVIKTESNILNVSILIITLLLACFIGFVDDILGWKKGLKQWQKLLITIPIAIPLVVINAGRHIMSIPFFGPVNFGLVYPLVLIPLAVVGAANGYNLLAGYNGLEAGLGVIVFGALGTISLITGQLWLTLTAGIIIAVLFGFLIFNWYPAKVFPGNSLTYSLGALVACFAILGNIEKFALILFIPFIIEGFLKLRSNFKAENFGIPNKDNSLNEPYKKVYSLTHLSLRILKKLKPSKKVYEKDVVAILVLFEILLAVVAVLRVV